MKVYSLYELNNIVAEAIDGCMYGEYLVQAEISDCTERGGHCYLELVEKRQKGNAPIARAHAIIWSNVWALLAPTFEQIVGQRLTTGMKVLLTVYPNFHATYGFSWIVTDIDPTYTIGDMAQRRLEIIKKLKEEGILDLNKDIDVPAFCQNIAVISSPQAAGYGDFCNELEQNPYGFKFDIELFPAIMQGENVEESIIDALNTIYTRQEQDEENGFDCVIIIRGGGASSDLAGFDSYRLAENITQFPLPIITGIGHERDDTILDMVAHTRVKTPTAAAEFLITHLVETSNIIERASKTIQHTSTKTLHLAEQKIQILTSRMREIARLTIERRRNRLSLLKERLNSHNPHLLLERGYTMTLKNGKIIKDLHSLQNGDEITTIFNQGLVTSIVNTK